MTEQRRYTINVAGTAPSPFPAETLYGLLWTDGGDALDIPQRYPFQGEWGGAATDFSLRIDGTSPMPTRLDTVYLSIVEKRFYWVEQPLPAGEMAERWERQAADCPGSPFDGLLVGFAPYGQVAVWLTGRDKSVLALWTRGKEVEVSMADFLPSSPDYKLADYCDWHIRHDEGVEDNLRLNGLPPRGLFDGLMQQFCYRYVPLFQHYDEDGGGWRKYGDGEAAAMPQLDYIEEALSDGTHDCLRDGSLLSHHMGGKPRRLCVAWHVGKRSYTAWLWFDTVALHEAFTRFYGTHPDTRADLIMRIDCHKDKYELSLYRQGLREPQPISPGAWQMIVFRNGFECHRSDNYSQPSGAWGWQ